MKKKLIVRLIACFLIAAVSVYFFNEYKTKNLVKTFLHTNNLSENKISILDESTITMTNIDKNNPDFPTLKQALKGLEVKRTNAKFSYMEGYVFVFFQNSAFYQFSINENGTLLFDNKTYKIQGEESVKDLFMIIKKALEN
ncbi:hypothetical protein AMS59_22865 [Lysinibacillus sp. FJAT-14745]|uniref:hypothetical protein n=1 Tax=Lysinibacillus sp. FJAT-14745 TaxID=1704289 RepID=UPI0006ABBB37|nr:hypothetical protein [Lysinibacillus sp. FJAT-14745]KOP69754.1 hypothetical protein AMS59_22865 [Lysinibacillus sp. FJAT-14745]